MSARHLIPPSDAEISRLKEMWQRNTTIVTIAQALGRSEKWVRRQAKRHCADRYAPVYQRHSPETIEIIRIAWIGGESASTIALRMGLTRNVVIGVVSRHCEKRGRVSKPEKSRKYNVAPKSAPVTRRDMAEALRPEPYLILPDDPPLIHSLIDLEDNQCRWPIGDPQEMESFGFCGKVRHSHHFAYCSQHLWRATARINTPDPGQTAANDSQPHNRIVEAAE